MRKKFGYYGLLQVTKGYQTVTPTVTRMLQGRMKKLVGYGWTCSDAVGGEQDRGPSFVRSTTEGRVGWTHRLGRVGGRSGSRAFPGVFNPLTRKPCVFAITYKSSTR